MAPSIVVIGAGVSGLTTALLLSTRKEYQITVVAKHMPGDYDIEYASPWAGANFMPTSKQGTKQARWEQNTWRRLEKLAEEVPRAGLHFQPCTIFNRKSDIGSATAEWLSELLSPDPWFSTLFKDYRKIPDAELAEDVGNAHTFTSVCINTAIYLPWLLSQCVRNGVIFKRGVFDHISDASVPGVHHTGRKPDLIVNCTGLSSLTLGGVADHAVYPIRGQICVVRNEADGMYAVSGTDDGHEETTYLMTRAAGGGTVLGGSYQKDNSSAEIDFDLSLRLMERCVKVCPALTDGRGVEFLDVIRHGIGLRPGRHGGPRVEQDTTDGIPVVHNYGHGGAGYQISFGCAEDVVEMVRERLRLQPRL